VLASLLLLSSMLEASLRETHTELALYLHSLPNLEHTLAKYPDPSANKTNGKLLRIHSLYCNSGPEMAETAECICVSCTPAPDSAVPALLRETLSSLS